MTNVFIAIILVPLVWILLSKFVVQPITQIVRHRLPVKMANILTKEIGG